MAFLAWFLFLLTNIRRKINRSILTYFRECTKKVHIIFYIFLSQIFDISIFPTFEFWLKNSKNRCQ
tara:strand:- start:1870 stop:2067 length:198 start_codon:yes stop_codon:yes gene_type:complete